MREGRERSAQNKNKRQGAAPALHHRAAVVLNILRHRKAEAGHRRVDNAVDDAVKLVLFPDEEDEQDECLGTLLDDWRRDYRAESSAGAHTVSEHGHGHAADSIDQEGEENRDERAPKKCRGQHPEWLRFVTINPKHEQ